MCARSALVFIIASVLLVCFPAGSSGDIYKYVDEEGNVYFTDGQPVSGKRLEKVYPEENRQERPDATVEEPPVEVDRFLIPLASVSNRRSARRRMLVDVTLTRDYRSITRKFVVDTGATSTVMTRSDAMALGVEEKDVSGSGLGSVAGGGLVVAHRTRISRLEVGDVVVHSPEVAILKHGETRLLGMDILGRYNIQVDLDRKVLILRKR
jgi:clan AA aspartic protease (TIGR02281 family)